RFRDLRAREVTAEITKLRGRGAEHITFMGGETFFRKDLGRILAHARAEGFSRVGVTTNGTVLSKKGFVRELRESGLDFIEFSVHGHTPELSNAIAGTSYTHERQSLALDEIRDEKLPTIMNVVVCRQNKDHLVDIARYVCERYAGLEVRFKFKFVSLQGLAAKSEDVLRYQEVDAIPVGDYLAERGVPFWYYNFPLCRLGRHAGHAHEVGTLAVDETYFDYDHWGARGYYDSGHQLLGRVWPTETCGACTMRPLCPGLDEQYRRASGTSALARRTDDPEPILAFALRDRGVDPARAAERLPPLQKAPRPTDFQHTDPRLVEFERADG